MNEIMRLAVGVIIVAITDVRNLLLWKAIRAFLDVSFSYFCVV